MFFGTAQYLQAYGDTDYLVQCDRGELAVRVGEKSRQVDQLLCRSKARTAARLGRHFRQNAVIFVSYGKPAELVMLR